MNPTEQDEKEIAKQVFEEFSEYSKGFSPPLSKEEIERIKKRLVKEDDSEDEKWIQYN